MAAIFTFDPSLIESLAKVGVHVCYQSGCGLKFAASSAGEFPDFGVPFAALLAN
jgi:hypothetical protein